MPILNLTHSITNWNILFSQMGLASVFDANLDESQESLETFAGMQNYPLAQVTLLQHKTVLDIGIEDNVETLPTAPKLRPKKKSAQNDTRIVRLSKRSYQTTRIVQSPIMKVIQSSHPHKDTLMQQQSKHVPIEKAVPPKRIHVNLEEEFIYLILDNISGLVLAMGKYKAPEKN